MKIKDGVKIQGLHISMQPVLKNAGWIWDNLGQELVITCGLENIHSAGSLHYYGRAVDLRTRYFTTSEKILAKEDLQKALGEDYDVVLEDNHMHCEYDPPEVVVEKPLSIKEVDEVVKMTLAGYTVEECISIYKENRMKRNK